jgi:hypothetical protein
MILKTKLEVIGLLKRDNVMSMVTSACKADIVSDDFVREHCPTELDDLIKFLEDNDSDLEMLHYEQSCGDFPTLDKDPDNENENHTKLMGLHQDLVDKFITETGLSLYSVFHSKDDRGDELDGGAFAVDGVYVLSEAGKKYKEAITEVAWTTCG